MSSHKEHSSGHGPSRGQERPHARAAAKSDPNKSSKSAAERSGRPTFDSRGNAVWEWQTEETGKFSKDVSTQRLKKLEATDLKLEETSIHRTLDSPNGPTKDRGFNPYDRASVEKSKLDAQTSKSSAPPARKPIKDLKRYEEWLKMKKRMETQKQDD